MSSDRWVTTAKAVIGMHHFCHMFPYVAIEKSNCKTPTVENGRIRLGAFSRAARPNSPHRDLLACFYCEFDIMVRSRAIQDSRPAVANNPCREMKLVPSGVQNRYPHP